MEENSAWSTSLNFFKTHIKTAASEFSKRSTCKSGPEISEKKITARKVLYRVFSGTYFPVFRLNTEVYGVNLVIHSKYRKILTRKISVFRYFLRSEYFTHVVSATDKTLMAGDFKCVHIILSCFEEELENVYLLPNWPINIRSNQSYN